MASLRKPRRILFMVKAGAPVDATIELFTELAEVRTWRWGQGFGAVR